MGDKVDLADAFAAHEARVFTYFRRMVGGREHLGIAGLWTLHPLAGSGTYAVTVSASISASDFRFFVVSALQNGLAVAALWSPVALGALAGLWARKPR